MVKALGFLPSHVHRVHPPTSLSPPNPLQTPFRLTELSTSPQRQSGSVGGPVSKECIEVCTAVEKKAIPISRNKAREALTNSTITPQYGMKDYHYEIYARISCLDEITLLLKIYTCTQFKKKSYNMRFQLRIKIQVLFHHTIKESKDSVDVNMIYLAISVLLTEKDQFKEIVCVRRKN